MGGIKLGRIPDRTPVRITISVPPELGQTLNDYSDFYAQSYGVAEPLSELIPAMLQSFVDGDHAFRRARRTSS
ncbi:MAG: DUF2274 domain-containing protein [Sphingomicrobium sp.]